MSGGNRPAASFGVRDVRVHRQRPPERLRSAELITIRTEVSRRIAGKRSGRCGAWMHRGRSCDRMLPTGRQPQEARRMLCRKRPFRPFAVSFRTLPCQAQAQPSVRFPIRILLPMPGGAIMPFTAQTCVGFQESCRRRFCPLSCPASGPSRYRYGRMTDAGTAS